MPSRWFCPFGILAPCRFGASLGLLLLTIKPYLESGMLLPSFTNRPELCMSIIVLEWKFLPFSFLLEWKEGSCFPYCHCPVSPFLGGWGGGGGGGGFFCWCQAESLVPFGSVSQTFCFLSVCSGFFYVFLVPVVF